MYNFKYYIYIVDIFGCQYKKLPEFAVIQLECFNVVTKKIHISYADDPCYTYRHPDGNLYRYYPFGRILYFNILHMDYRNINYIKEFIFKYGDRIELEQRRAYKKNPYVDAMGKKMMYTKTTVYSYRADPRHPIKKYMQDMKKNFANQIKNYE